VLKLSHGLVSTGWRAHPNCNLVLNCSGSSRRFLRQKLQDGNHIPPQNLQKDPCATFVRTDDVLLEVRNRKEGCCAWSLVPTTSCTLALKLTTSLRFLKRNLSLFVSSPCLASLNSASISFTSNQVCSLVRIYHRALLVHLRASTLHGVGPPSSHVVLISHVTLCIHLNLLSKRISSLITPMIDDVWKFLPRLRMSPLTLGYEQVIFPF
jgi:hypothetical protein